LRTRSDPDGLVGSEERALTPSFASRNPLVAFLALTFGISWVGGFAWIVAVSNWASLQGVFIRAYAPTLVVVIGPGLAALVIARLTGGKPAAREMMARMRPSPAYWRWYLAVPAGAILATALAYLVASVPLRVLAGTLMGSGPVWLAAHFAAQLLLIGIGEELGWRGWLLPHLAGTRSLGSATLLTILVWEVWHLPKFATGLGIAAMLMVQVAAVGVILSRLWVHMKGNLFGLAMVHASVNAPVVFVEQMERLAPDQLIQGWRYLTVIYALIAALVVVGSRAWWTKVGLGSKGITA
jgi:CAAX protease family protein